MMCFWQAKSDQKIPLTLRKFVFNQYVLPGLSYAVQTGSVTKDLIGRLAKAQKLTERLTQNIKLKY